MATLPSYFEGLLTPQDLSSLRGQALTSGLLSAGQALARSGAPSLTPGGSTGFADAAAQFYGGYQGTIDSALQNMIRAQQVQENVRKQQQAQRMRELMSSVITQQPQEIPMARGPESQLGMLTRPEFGGDMPGVRGQESALTETAETLRANLPKTGKVDVDKLMQVIAMTDPVEAAKLMMPKQGENFQILSPQQKQAFGLPADGVFQISNTGKISEVSKGPLVTNIIDKGANELDKLDAQTVAGMSAKANSAREFANNAAAINNLLKGAGGGAVVKVGADLVTALGLPSDTASANALATALQTRAATQVRAAGSGSTSDLEFRAYLSVFPSLSNTEQGRALMAKGLQAFADRDALIEKKARELFAQKKYSAQAIAEYDRSLGPVLGEEFKPFMGQAGGSQRRDLRTK
jgi:hypothetical protein